MIFKLAVAILALAAVAHAGYVVFDTYPDQYCNTTVVARFITLSSNACRTKRAVEQIIPIPTDTLCTGVVGQSTYYIATDNCNSVDGPSLPEGWQGVQLTADSSCNATADTQNTNYLGAPAPLSNTPIAIFYGQLGVVEANTSFSCGADGVQAVSTCISFEGSTTCVTLNMPTGNCTADNANVNYGLQESCVAAPVAVPVAAPVADGPVAAAPTAPTASSPVKAPAKTSSASSLVFGSAAVLSVVALL